MARKSNGFRYKKINVIFLLKFYCEILISLIRLIHAMNTEKIFQIIISREAAFTAAEIAHFRSIGHCTLGLGEAPRAMIKWNANELCLSVPDDCLIEQLHDMTNNQRLINNFIFEMSNHDYSYFSGLMDLYSIEPRGRYNYNALFRDFLAETRERLRLSNVRIPERLTIDEPMTITLPPWAQHQPSYEARYVGDNIEVNSRRVVDEFRERLGTIERGDRMASIMNVNWDSEVTASSPDGSIRYMINNDVWAASEIKSTPPPQPNPKCNNGHETELSSLPKNNNKFYFGRCKTPGCNGFVRAFDAITNSDVHGASQKIEQTTNP